MTHGILLVIGLVLLFLLLGPLVTIWALNTLFGLNIAVNIATWFAALWLTILFAAKLSVSKK